MVESCDEDSHITLDKCKKPNKDVYSKASFWCVLGSRPNHGLLFTGRSACHVILPQLLSDYSALGTVQYKDLFLKATTKIEEMKSDMINTQKSVIQGKLLDMESKELDSVQRTVKTAVEISFK